MADLANEVRAFRARGAGRRTTWRGERACRAGVSAIETGRLVPSTAAALALAAALGARVEELFRLAGGPAATHEARWTWPPEAGPCRYWLAELGGIVRALPVEPTPTGGPGHDGLWSGGPIPADLGRADPARTLVLACCDPAVGLLAEALGRGAGSG